MILCKRAYLPAADDDGQRVLVDRLWPRNRRKEDLPLDGWLPQLAPTTALRRDFKSGQLDFTAFRQRYRQELAAHPEHWWPLLERAAHGTLTLIYAARDEQQNNAQVLAEWLEEELERRADPSSPTCYAGKPLE
ncbi:putative bacteriophage protein [Stutzerimonas stutzeri TS44]|nr:putative bacteriophage protein [Stutzerimonas stutzeri TS44]